MTLAFCLVSVICSISSYDGFSDEDIHHPLHSLSSLVITDSETHQAHEDTEELDHICVCHRVESSNKCVEDGNQG